MAATRLFQATSIVIFGCLSSYVFLAYLGDFSQNRPKHGLYTPGNFPKGRLGNGTPHIHQASPYNDNLTSIHASFDPPVITKKAVSDLLDLYPRRLETHGRRYPETLDYSDIYNCSASRQFGHTSRSENSRWKSGDRRHNILFIVVDDLRPQLNSYDSLFASSKFRMHTPNIDALASKSLVLKNAFVQYSSCNPSRASYMTSRKPDTTKVWDLTTFWRVSGGNFTTIPQFYKDDGYHAAGFGKIYHPGKAGGFGDPLSWTERFFLPPHGGFWADKVNVPEFWRPVSKKERELNPLPDEEILVQAVRQLHMYTHKRRKKHPFFIGVGFQKPHLPIVVPEEFLKLYPLNDIPLAKYPKTPWKYPRKAFYPNLEVLNCTDVDNLDGSYYEMNKTFPDDFSRVLRRAYFTGVSYIDYLVGILLDELHTLGLDKSTIITFKGDHGWHLGENALWGKHSNFDRGVQAPLMIRYPGKTDKGIKSDALVEFMDLFPTLVDLTGHKPLLKCPEISKDIDLCTEGRSFAPLLLKSGKREHRKLVFSQHRYPGNAMAYTVRSHRFRYTETVFIRQAKVGDDLFKLIVEWHSQFGVELYDHEFDPEENRNVVGQPKYKRVQDELKSKLRAHFSSEITNVSKPMFYYSPSQSDSTQTLRKISSYSKNGDS